MYFIRLRKTLDFHAVMTGERCREGKEQSSAWGRRVESVPNGAAHQQRHRDRKAGEPGTTEQDRKFTHESRNERPERKTREM